MEVRRWRSPEVEVAGGGGGGEKMWRKGEERRKGEEKGRGEGERRSGEEKWRREGEKRGREGGLAGFQPNNSVAHLLDMRHRIVFFLFCWKNSSVGHNFFFVSNFENLKKV